MNDRSSTPKRRKKEHDFSVNAWRVVQQATGETDPARPEPAQPTPEERHAMAVTLGRLGGKKGGKARAAKLSTERLREIGRKAAQARWGARSTDKD